MKISSNLKKAIWTAAMVATAACGRAPAESEQEELTFEEYQEAKNLPQDNWADVDVTFTAREAEVDGLGLSEGDSFDAEIMGCESGYGERFSENVASVRVKTGDEGCQSRIKELKLAGESFLFDTSVRWDAGTTLDAVGSFGNVMKLHVVSNINSPVVGGQSVVFIYELSNDMETTYNSVESLPSLPVEMYDNIVKVDGEDGSGIFDFIMGCEDEFDGEFCGDVAVEDLQVGMVRDDFGGELSLDECRDIASQNDDQDRYVSGSSIVLSGLQGPGPLYASENSDLIVAVSSGSHSSCKFFRVAVSL